MSWDLVPGQHLDRAEVHARFGGKPAGRISTAKSSHVFLFITPSDLASRFDGWTGEHVLFGGSGGLDGGDQTLTRYNGSVFRHVEEGRALRLFLESDDRTVRYIGEYRLDPQRPYVLAEGPADIRRPLEVRRVFVFRLHDQARFFTPRPRRVLLLPNEPDADLAALLRSQRVTAVWPSGPSDFARTGPTA